MNVDGRCPRGRSGDVTGGGQRGQVQTQWGNGGGHLQRGQRSPVKGGKAPPLLLWHSALYVWLLVEQDRLSATPRSQLDPTGSLQSWNVNMIFIVTDCRFWKSSMDPVLLLGWRCLKRVMQSGSQKVKRNLSIWILVWHHSEALLMKH